MHFATPLRHCLRLAVKGKDMVASRVVILCLAVGPYAVIRRIAFIVIQSLNRSTLRTIPHILNERFKGMFPSFADTNTASAVVAIRLVRRVIATVSHVSPDSIKRMVGLARFLVQNIATVLSLGAFQVVAISNNQVSAQALTFPQRRLSRVSSQVSFDRQEIKSFANHIFEIWASFLGNYSFNHISILTRYRTYGGLNGL
jgi:hypothetical protein